LPSDFRPEEVDKPKEAPLPQSGQSTLSDEARAALEAEERRYRNY
jgi:hypothetical protein